jgi:hypothetical protein
MAKLVKNNFIIVDINQPPSRLYEPRATNLVRKFKVDENVGRGQVSESVKSAGILQPWIFHNGTMAVNYTVDAFGLTTLTTLTTAVLGPLRPKNLQAFQIMLYSVSTG